MSDNLAVIDYTIENYFEYCSDFALRLQQNRNVIHPPGYHDCHISLKKKIIFMHIDKCASTSLRLVLKKCDDFYDMSNRFSDNNFIKIKNFLQKRKFKNYSIIRDPKSRYISGLQEFLLTYNLPLNYVENNLSKNKFIFDEHTSPQDCFLTLCDQCNYIKLDNEISKKISNILNRNIILPKANVSNKYNKNISTRLFEKYCENNKNFYNLYEKDFYLYNLSF